MANLNFNAESAPKEVIFNEMLFRRYERTDRSGYFFYVHQASTPTGRLHLKLHRAVYEFCSGNQIPPGHCVHHIDHNPLNNSFENLILVTEVEHGKLHAASIAGIGKRPWTEKRKSKQAKQMLAKWKEAKPQSKHCKMCSREFYTIGVRAVWCSPQCSEKSRTPRRRNKKQRTSNSCQPQQTSLH